MFSFYSRISLKDKILFYESITNLLDGGITILMALRGFAKRLPQGAIRDAVENTIFFVESGDQLNMAMRKLPNFYTDKEIAIVESGEQTGMLKDSFASIANELRMQSELKQKIISAMTYPFIIFIFLILAICVVMIYVIPQIMPVIVEMATEITLSTRSLIVVSDFLRENVIWLLGILVALGLVFKSFTLTEIGKMWWDRFKIFNFLTGKLYKNYLIVQVMGTLYLLLSSGVGIVKSLRLTGASAGNIYMLQVFNTIADDISKGEKISDAMQNTDKEQYIFTPDILQLIENAEKTSTIHQVTQKISIQYRREVDAALAIMVKFIEPVALLGAGLFVTWFALAIFSVIMQITKSAGIG